MEEVSAGTNAPSPPSVMKFLLVTIHGYVYATCYEWPKVKDGLVFINCTDRNPYAVPAVNIHEIVNIG